MQVDARGRLHQPAPEARGVGLDQRHRHPIVVDHAQVGGVPLLVRHPVPPNRCRFGGNGGAARVQALGRQQGGAVGPFVEHRRPVVAGRHGGLDEQVGPPRIAGVLRQGQAGGDPCCRQREVPLAGRRDGPDPVVPGHDGEALDPVGLTTPQVVGAEVPAAEPDQPGPELALVEARPTVIGDRPQRSRHAGPADAGARPGGLARQLVQVYATGVVDRRQRADEEGRGREAVVGQSDSGRQHLGQGPATEALVQRHPAVHAARDGDRPHVVAHRHLHVALGPQLGGVGPAPGPARTR